MSERKYFPINESSARTAHNMISMRDYSEGSTTSAYRSEVYKAYELADKVADKRPAEAERAYRLAERYAKKMAEYYNKDSSIGMMCPSVLISGAGNFPTKKKERQVAAWERNHQFYNDIQSILRKIEGILYGKEIIKSDDERAIEKLEEKLEDLKNLQELMKTANKAIRFSISSSCAQAGEAYNHVPDDKNRCRATYLTFVRLSSSQWRFAGYCYAGETTNRVEVETSLERRIKEARTNG